MENQPTAEPAVESVESTVNYEDAMLDAFVQKPEKLAWYKKSFAKFDKNGVDSFAWCWSWWAFFATFWFLIYRKAYLPALAFFAGSVAVSLLPLGLIGTLIYMVITGGTATFFVYKTYKDLQAKTEAASPEPEKQLETMRLIGGYHTWVAVVAAVINVVIIGAIAVSLAALGSILAQPH